MDDARTALVVAAERVGVPLIRLSRMIRRNDAYLQQYVKRGTPRRLPERERELLAGFLGISQSALGGPIDTSVPVRRLDVAASAGPGAVSSDDPLAAVERFPASLVERLSLRPDALTLIVARGDSMEPTIADGDDILVDAADRRVSPSKGRRPAIFVLRLDGALVVKRLHLAGGMVVIESDNPDAAPIAPVPAAAADVIGRVVWLGRKLG